LSTLPDGVDRPEAGNLPTVLFRFFLMRVKMSPRQEGAR
jgi:hypothetical protein